MQVLLFDLGGVVIDIDFNRPFQHWQPISNLTISELKEVFSFDAQHERHERGEITASAYFEHLCTTLQLKRDFKCIREG